MTNDEKFMAMALKEARIAAECGDIPIGCVITEGDKVIAKAHNMRQLKKLTTAHAEILAINKACKEKEVWILDEATMYVTIEPCPMCAGAILNARIKRLVIGAMEPKFGACGSIVNLLDNPKFNHQVTITSGVLAEEASSLMKNFFQLLRQNKN